MWEVASSADYEKRAKKFAKANRQDLLNVMDNFAAYLAALRNGLKPQQIIRGFVHHEPHGIKALDASGPGKHKKALRLYIYPDEQSETLRILTVGDKSTQKEDIRLSSLTVEALLEEYRSQQDEPEY